MNLRKSQIFTKVTGGKIISIVEVIDSMPGAGKTRWMINYMNKLPKSERIIYITPLITETERIKEQCPKRNFVLPNGRAGQGYKFNHFKDLLRQKRNISSTHALFLTIDEEMIDLIREGNYILVLDEVLNIIDDAGFYKDNDGSDIDGKEMIVNEDMSILQSEGSITVDDYCKISWNEGAKPLHLYKNFKQAIDKEQIYYVSNSRLLWIFPPQIFKNTFKEIFVMTYQFNYQLQASYFKYFDIPFKQSGIIKKMNSDSDYRFTKVSYTKYLEYDKLLRIELKELIEIYKSENLNSFGNLKKTLSKYGTGLRLSKSGYDSMTDKDFELIGTKATTYQKNVLKDRTATVMWTTYKDYKKNIRKPKRGTNSKVRLTEKSFVSLNSRATNDYRDKTGLIYLVDRYPIPSYNTMLSKKGASINKDEFAISEMLQWIFRSAIRDGKKIQIFIPSERMRCLLESWLNGEI